VQGRDGPASIVTHARDWVDRQDPGSLSGVAIGAWRRYRAVDGPLQSSVLRSGYKSRMAMLKRCSFTDCETLTLLSAFCLDHEQMVASDGERDEPTSREIAALARPAPPAAR
jgi:hypothetical protein